jgi:hypothetical protein
MKKYKKNPFNYKPKYTNKEEEEPHKVIDEIL